MCISLSLFLSVCVLKPFMQIKQSNFFEENGHKTKKNIVFSSFFRSILYAYTYTHTLYFTFEQRKGHWLNQAYYIILSFGFCNRFYSLSPRFLFGPLHRHCKFFAFLLFIHPIVSDRSHSILAANAESSEREWKRKTIRKIYIVFGVSTGSQCDMKINWIDLTHIMSVLHACVCVFESDAKAAAIQLLSNGVLYVVPC